MKPGVLGKHTREWGSWDVWYLDKREETGRPLSHTHKHTQHMQVPTYTHTQAHISTCEYTCIHTNTNTNIHICTCTHTCKHLYTQFTHAHIHTNTYTHIHKCRHVYK